MRLFRSAGVLGFACACVGTLASQDAPAPHESAWSLGPRGLVQSERYVEAAPSGAVLDSERGTLSGVGLELIHRDGSGHWTLDWQRASAALDYLGDSQSGLPLQLRTQVTESRRSFTRWQQGPSWGPWRIDGMAALTLARRDRAIASSPLNTGVHEVLDWAALRAGIAVHRQLPGGAWLQGTLQASRGLPGQRLHVDLEGYAQPLTLVPGPRYGSGAGLSAGMPLAAGLRIWASAEGWRERIGATSAIPDYRNGQPIGTVQFPGATVWQRSLAIGLEWRPAP